MEDKIGIGLSENKAKELFEAHFGKDTATRSRKQWKALIKQYGYEQVIQIEGMNKAQVKSKCKNG